MWDNGSALVGAFTELALNGNEVATGYTPVSFNTTAGVNYTVTVADSPNHHFNRWTSGFSSRAIPVTALPGPIPLIAIYTVTAEPPPPTPYSITVTSSALNGTSIGGFLVDLRVGGYAIQSGFTPATFTNLEPGVNYQVVAFWAGNYYFRHFSDGDLNRYELLSFNSTGAKQASFNAVYEYVTPSKAATLNVIAEFTNGTVIGTTFNNTNYIEHTPGMWFTVTPPGSKAAFTGSDTGGSLLPFVLFSGKTYTVQMTNYGSVKFAHWSDNGNTNATRLVTLNQKATTIIAIYTQSPTASAVLTNYYYYLVFAIASVAGSLPKKDCADPLFEAKGRHGMTETSRSELS